MLGHHTLTFISLASMSGLVSRRAKIPRCSRA